jgi:hypothetical protein
MFIILFLVTVMTCLPTMPMFETRLSLPRIFLLIDSSDLCMSNAKFDKLVISVCGAEQSACMYFGIVK